MKRITLRTVRKGACDYERVRQLYLRSFPAAERAPFLQLMRWSDGRRAQMYALYEGGAGAAGNHVCGEWIGLAYFVQYRDIMYLFYLAIDESKQGRGYGSALLAAARRHFTGRRVILNIEEVDEQAPNYEERVKRKRFYERNGLHEMGYTVRELGVVYEMLGMGEPVSKKEYIALMRSLIGRLGAWYIYRGQEEN